MKEVMKVEEKRTMWNIESVVKNGNNRYKYAVVKNHPKATKRGYVLLHRVIMENHLNRLLYDDEIVHHINNDKLDNRIENLQVMLISEHVRLHKSTGRTIINLKCPWCKSLFSKEKRQTHLSKTKNKFTCCSNSCRGKMSSFIQYNGITDVVILALSENIQS